MAEDTQTNLSDALATLGGIVGLVMGIGAASHDPDMTILAGAFIGGIMGAIAGKIAGVALSLALQIAFALLLLAIAGLRLFSLIDMLAS